MGKKVSKGPPARQPLTKEEREKRLRRQYPHLFVEYQPPEYVRPERCVEEMSQRLRVTYERTKELAKAFGNFAGLIRNGNIPEPALEPLIRTIGRTWPVVHDCRTEESLCAVTLIEALKTIRKLGHPNAEAYVRSELRRVAPAFERRAKPEDLNEAIRTWQFGTQSDRVQALEKLLKRIGIHVKDGSSLLRQSRRKRQDRSAS
jgi:hypothetical protein